MTTADEQHEEGLEAAFVPWASQLRTQILKDFPLPLDVQPIPDSDPIPPAWLLSIASKDYRTRTMNGATKERLAGSGVSEHSTECLQQNQEVKSNAIPGGAFSHSREIEVVLNTNMRVTPIEHWQDVRHMLFTASNHIPYSPGDVLIVQPQNSVESVNNLIRRMKWDEVADQAVCFEPQQHAQSAGADSSPYGLPLGYICTLRHLLANFVDLTAVPHRSFFSAIAHFTPSQYHKDRLLEFTMPQYLDELYDYTTRPRRSILEILEEFDSVQIPWQSIGSVFPQLRGRQFSIASGGFLKQDADGNTRFELLVAIVRYKTIIKKIREGVCSRYLADLTPGTRLRVKLQKSSLELPNDLSRPVIMIGPGTGIAPIRSFLWELNVAAEKFQAHNQTTTKESRNPELSQTCVLFFGCRNKESDYFFKEEWDILRQKAPLQIFTAFSRDQRQKIYVQDLIRQKSAEVFDLLENHNAIIFVCGSSGKMPRAVRSSFVDVIVKEHGVEEAAAASYLENLEKVGRYKQETW